MSIVDDIKAGILKALYDALCRAEKENEIDLAGAEWPSFVLEIPREKTHGDYATNAAMLLAKPARKAPRQIAEILVKHLQLDGTFVARTEIAGPGFINFYLDPAWLTAVLVEIGGCGADYGRAEKNGRTVNVEFVSANPTGPLHVGHGRNAAVGSVIANTLEWSGWEVTREFYINDAGNQVKNFGRSLEVRYRQALGQDAVVPQEGYHGEDLLDLMRDLVAREGDKYLQVSDEEREEFLTRYGLRTKLEDMQRDLANFGVSFDIWFSEQSLHDAGSIGSAVEHLVAGGHAYEQEGAIWLRSTAFGDDKDRVIIRANGVPTYVAADLAYHRDKYSRGYDRVIDVWGADHHGYIQRMKAGIAALGWDPDTFDVVLYQLVNLIQDGQPVVMSKRSGRLVTLRDVIDEVGRDAARFFYIMRSADTQLDFDLDLAKSQSDENPVYYAQYAHARICSILNQAVEAGLLPSGFDFATTVASLPGFDRANLGILPEDVERDLVKALAAFPDEIKMAADRLEPHRVARYVLDLASVFHSFYNACRVISSDVELSRLRLVLVDSVRQVVANGLAVLGVSAPTRM